jgi:hypothetical protein
MVAAEMLAQISQVFAWYNAVFVVLFGVGLLFTFLQLVGMGHGSGVDADADADIDADADVDAGVDTDADVDAHADVDADADAHVEADAEGHVEAHGPAVAAGHAIGMSGAFAQLFALGKVPLSIALMLLCYTMGTAGWISNGLLEPRLKDPAVFFPLSLLLALVTGFAVLRFAGTLMGRYLPPVSTSAVHKRQLVGLTAKAVLPVDEKFGQACLYDQYGTLHVVGCRVRDGAPNIEKGAPVVLIKYMADRDLFVVGRA